MRKGMRKAASFSRWSLLLGVACGLAMLPVANRAARAEAISMSLSVNGGPLTTIDGLATISMFPTQSYTISDIAGLNTLLTGDGSVYQFSSLGGSSTTFPGTSTGGTLDLTGGVFIPAGTLVPPGQSLSITETLTGFTTPSGPSGTLSSSSSATFNEAGTGNFHTANSSFNGIPTPSYMVASSSSLLPNSSTGSASAPILPFAPLPYELANSISFSLISSGASDQFGVSVNATATAIPEPASVVTMLIGLPLPLVGLAWLRRRRAVVENS